MAIIKVLGACSGTEPMKNLHHTSLVLTVNERNYFFDAGENCSHTAHISGVELLKTRAVFISHTHYDHIGGLMGLFWTLNKLNGRLKTPLADGEIKLFIPELSVWEHIYQVLKQTTSGFNHEFGISVNIPCIGSFFEDENIKVTAFESHHMPKGNDGHICSFGYLIEVGEKRIVFSGDIKDMNDLMGVMEKGCDILFCETGHHRVQTVCEFAQAHRVGRLILTHHGREILEKRPAVSNAIAQCKIPVEIAFDGSKMEI